MNEIPAWFERRLTFHFPLSCSRISARVCAARRPDWKSFCANFRAAPSPGKLTINGPRRNKPVILLTWNPSGSRESTIIWRAAASSPRRT